MGGIGMMSAWASAEKSTDKLHARVDVPGTPLDPAGGLDVKMIR